MTPQPGPTLRPFGRILALASAAWLLPAIATAPARAGFVVSVQSVTAAAGSSNDTFNVTLMNTGPSAVSIGGFAFKIAAGAGATLTAVDINTTPAYIFAGHSAFGPDISDQPPNLPGSMLAAEDNKDTGSISLGSGAVAGLGDVHFNLSSSAKGAISITLLGFPSTNISNGGVDITQSVGTTFTGGTITVSSGTVVPEPSSLVLTALSMALGIGYRRIGRRHIV